MRVESKQAGMTLIEVLVALLVFAVGVLGVAMLQLNALKYTDSSMRSTQISFIALDLFERIRANPDANYTLASLSQAPTSGNPDVPRDQDLFDFASQLRRMVGNDAQASIVMNGSTATITLGWNDSRAEQEAARMQTLTLSSLVAAQQGVSP